MTSITRRAAVIALCLPAALWLGSCGQGADQATGTSSLTIEVVNLVGAQGSQLSAELVKNVDYLEKAPMWTFLTTDVDASPFEYSDTQGLLPEGEFGLMVRAGSDKQTETAKGKGQGCEMTVLLGKDEAVTVSIDGLNDFGDKGYGPCAAQVSRS